METLPVTRLYERQHGSCSRGRKVFTMVVDKPRSKPLSVDSSEGDEPPRCHYSPRGRQRLLIAARLMRLSWPICDADIAFFSRVLTSIRRLGQSKQDELRALVDWVEDYEEEEVRMAKAGGGSAASQQRSRRP
jgi:hypothetical protein